MKADELMLGNYFLDLNNEIDEVYDIYFDTDEGVRFINNWNISVIKPVLLTERWLIKFGFKKIDKDINGYYVWMIEHITVFEQNKGYDYNDSTNIKYVHQLQNLYFALTGKELKSIL